MDGKIIASDGLTEETVLARFTDQQAAETQTEPASQPEPQVAGAAAPLQLTAEQLQALIQTAVDESTTTLRQQIDGLAQAKQEAEEQKSSLEKVFQVLGRSAPAVQTRLAASRDRAFGLSADFIAASDSAPSRSWFNRSTGERVIQRDLSRARHLFYTQRDQLRQDMEAYARRHGLLQGGFTDSDAPTLRTDIPPAFLDYISLVLRETHSSRYIYWQFPFYELELGKGPGDTIQVARFRWLPEAATVADRTLIPGTNLNATSQNLTAAAVSIQLQERGLGRPPSEPVAVPEFLSAYSLLNLENAVVSRLGHDYEHWEDLSIRSLYFSTTRIVYNDRSGVTVTPADVAAGDDGTLTENFLFNLYAYLSGRFVPPLDDGCYILAVHDTGLAQLKASIANRYQYLDAPNLEELSNLLQSASNRQMPTGKASGYAGKIAGFHVFSTNAHSLGIAGTPGAQNETLGIGSRLTRTSFAFGRAAVARAIGLEAEIRRDANDDFGRLNRWTWLSHETAAALDIDPAVNAEQQLRVVQVRTIDVAV